MNFKLTKIMKELDIRFSEVDGIKLEGDISPQEMFPIYLSNYDIDFLGKKAEELGVDTGTGYLSTFFA